MAKTDWTMIDEVKPSDMNSIGEELNELRDDIDNIQPASLTVAGITKLNNATTSTSQTDAATPKAVNDARVAAISAAATDATTKANTAETNAKNQADAKFRTPAQINRANLLKNSSGLMGFQYWTKVTPGWTVYTNPTVGQFFSQDGAVASGQYAVLDSEVIGVYQGTHYVQAMFHTTNSGPNAVIIIEIKNAANDQTINSMTADNNTWWHRKSSAINIPTGVSAIKIRLVVSNYPGGSNIGFSRIGFYEGSADIPYTHEFDIRALYEQNEVVKQSGVDAKNGIVDAINAKGGSASTSDTWATLAAKIQAIETTKKKIGTFVINASGQATVTGLGFTPRNIMVNDATYPTGVGSTFFLSYSADAYTLRNGAEEPLNQTRGKNNGTTGENQITVTSDGFTINAPAVDNGRTYRYVATS